MGVWEMCSYDIISIFSDSLALKGYLEYPSLYTGPFFVSLYFYLEFFDGESKIIKKIYKIIVTLQGIFPVAATILHFTNIIRYPAILRVCHILLFINMTFVMIVLFRRVLQKKGTHKYLISGLMLMIIVTILDMGRYYYLKTFSTKGLDGYTSYLLISFFVFLISLIIDFLINQRLSLYKLAQAETMDKLAHNDIMTGLENRLSFEEKLTELKNSTNIYGIISIDMNNLKITNDKYGHQEGDRLLKDFSLILKDSCSALNLNGFRIGGDEFVIIIPDIAECTFEKIIEELTGRCNLINKERKPLPISFAYGCCDSSNQKDVTEVYKLADNRMYEFKIEMKKKRL